MLHLEDLASITILQLSTGSFPVYYLHMLYSFLDTHYVHGCWSGAKPKDGKTN